MKRIIAAFFHSMAGLKHGFKYEAALRQELILLAISIPLALLLSTDPWRLLLLWGALLLVLITELLNTGIEKVADKVTREFSPEIKFAKDAGSAAVLCALLICVGVWGLSLLERVGVIG